MEHCLIVFLPWMLLKPWYISQSKVTMVVKRSGDLFWTGLGLLNLAPCLIAQKTQSVSQLFCVLLLVGVVLWCMSWPTSPVSGGWKDMIACSQLSIHAPPAGSQALCIPSLAQPWAGDTPRNTYRFLIAGVGCVAEWRHGMEGGTCWPSCMDDFSCSFFNPHLPCGVFFLFPTLRVGEASWIGVHFLENGLRARSPMNSASQGAS